MSRTLSLIGDGWDSVRSMAAHGQSMDTLIRLRSLLARQDLPAPVACEAHRLAGELSIDADQYREARRHLRAAADIAPTHSETYYLWGIAFERDPHGCDRLAAKKFGKASELEPSNSVYRAAFGRAAVRSNRVKRGVRELLAAVDVSPGNVEVLTIAIEGLIEAREYGVAWRVVNQARFFRFDTAKNREVVALLERVRYESARCEQRETRRQWQDARFATDGGRMVLPFNREVTKKGRSSKAQSGESIRRDVVSLSKPHFPRLRKRRA